MAADVIGIISGAIGIFMFAENQFADKDSTAAKFRLELGNNGAQGRVGGLEGAGGNPPDVRIWSPEAEFIGIDTNDNGYCQDGSIVCDFQVDNVKQAPEYALFTANDDAICIAVMKTTYPNDEKYAAVIGNWAQKCQDDYGVSVATWYASDVYVPKQDGSGDENVQCAWIDANGDQPCTGIQVRWPDYDHNKYPGQNDPGAFCNNHPTLYFHSDNDPNSVTYYTRKRNLFADHPSVARSPAAPSSPYEAAERQRLTPNRKRSDPVISSLQWSHKLVKSFLPEQTASSLCKAKGSAGPSFVSHQERQFCFMPTKTMYPFCADVDSGLCWDEELNVVAPKLVDLLVPHMNFTSIVDWDTPRVVG